MAEPVAEHEAALARIASVYAALSTAQIDRLTDAITAQPVDDLSGLVRTLQERTPLGQLSNMEARTVFEFMEQRGYRITKVRTDG